MEAKFDHFALMSRVGYVTFVERVKSRRPYEEEVWDCQPEKLKEFILRMALIASEDDCTASMIARQVMVGLYQAGYGVDLIAFGRTVGMIQLQRSGEPITDKEVLDVVATVVPD